MLIEVEVSLNSLPVLKSVSATKFPDALPPALIAVTSVPGDGVAVGVGAGVFVGVGAGVFVGVGVGVGVPPDGCQISMALINGLSAVPWVTAITIWPLLLAAIENCFCRAVLYPAVASTSKVLSTVVPLVATLKLLCPPAS